MTDPFDTGPDATPLSPQERDGLIPSHICLRGELNEAEQLNMAEADQWAFTRRRNVFDEAFLRGLHRRMFGRVWRWAGQYRATERNLGVASYRIAPDMRQAIGDARLWADNGSFARDELAVRFHHRLVCIHPFPNGNGRWSRLVADLLAVRDGGRRFTWGRSDLRPASEVRRAYIGALRAADAHDLRPLTEFARS